MYYNSFFHLSLVSTFSVFPPRLNESTPRLTQGILLDWHKIGANQEIFGLATRQDFLSTGCNSIFWKIFELKIWKKPMLVLKQMIHQRKVTVALKMCPTHFKEGKKSKTHSAAIKFNKICFLRREGVAASW